VIRTASFIIALCLAAPAEAEGFKIRLQAGLNGGWSDASSLATSLGYPARFSQTGSARLMWDKSFGDLRVEVHSQLNFAHGDDVALATALAPFLPTPVPATLFNLTSTLSSTATGSVTNTIDRLSISYTTNNLVLRVGRQAITWGSGMVFHPGDIVAPFSPNAVDTSYKAGADMVYGQYLFDNGADIQVIAVPRAATLGGPIAFNSSTYAVRARSNFGVLDGSLMYARDRGDNVAAASLSGPLGEASWNAEYVHWTLASGAVHPSWLFNISNYGTLGDWNISYFAEYFHNGFGVGSGVTLAALPASLTKRMATGQVFYAGQDFLSLGGNIAMTADLSLAPNAIISLMDGSTLAGLTINYTLGDNTNLVFNYVHPFGGDGTEFGGRETTVGSGIFSGPSQSALLQIVHYF